jgi:hypothetical protein
MAERILFVYEGERTEAQIHQSCVQHFLNEEATTVIYSAYCSTIYSLFHTMRNDPDLDLFAILKEREVNEAALDELNPTDVSQIYLFFDYDAHASAASDEKLTQMLNYFDEETGVGKLYISYPMIEAIKHLRVDVNFETAVVPRKIGKAYKKLASEECDNCYKDLTNLSLESWNMMISEHCKKMNYIVSDDFSHPKVLIKQEEVFLSQQEKYIKPSNTVAVLSGFPVFIVDYYGCEYLNIIFSRVQI